MKTSTNHARFLYFVWCFGLSIFVIAGHSLTASAAGHGEEIYLRLQRANVLENYLVDLAQETAQTLVGVSGNWSGAGVNKRYRPGDINVYLVNGSRLPFRRNILAQYDVSLAGNNFGNALVDERTGMIFINTSFLKDFIAYRMLIENDMDSLQAAAFVKIQGTDYFRSLWHPNINPKLKSRRYRDLWLIAYRGMLAFVIGHEMGHIAVGYQNINFDEPVFFENKAERDVRWACPQLTDPSHRQKQKIEKQADTYAVNLINQVLFPDDISPRRFLYELGAHQYMMFQLKNEFLNATLVTKSPNIQRVIRWQLGDQLYRGLLASGEQADRGAVQVFYPRTHPSTIQRVIGSLNRLSQSRYSAFYNEGIGIGNELGLLNQIINDECRRLSQKSLQ